MQLSYAIQVSRKRIKSLILERNIPIESRRASKRRIAELEENLAEEKTRVAQL